uniref:Zinc finger and BTB domain containing 39 n=1 Tax=Crocodylus porosus TaxID=8502 RepID=A0A7M4EPZ5_CROPO
MDGVQLHSTNHPNNLLRELNKCRLSETMCDVTIVVGSRSFAAHKAVLACAAGYFQNLFLAAGLDAARTYVVDFITPANFEKILSFMYTAELFTDLINVGVIYEVAEKLGMEDLLRACHSTFPDLESTAVPKQPSLVAGEGRPGSLGGPSGDPSQPPGDARGSGEPLGSERGYVLHGEAAGSCKEDALSDAGHGLPLPHPAPSKAEQEQDLPGQFAPAVSLGAQPGSGSTSVTVKTVAGSCPSYKVIELSDDSEEELAFESDGRDGRAVPCQVCRKVLEPNIQLIRQHARDHVDLLTGNCKVCETHFQDRNARVTHVLSHIGIFLFSCDMCETKFFTQWQLTLHRREGVADGHVIVHPSDLHVLEHVNVKGQACGLCDQRHLSLCGLLWHGLSHLGISVFSCSVCANSFVDRHLLEKHMAVHQSLEEALYRCHYCGQSFKLEAAYRYHVSQHKCSGSLELRPGFGDRKYSCKVCGKRFAHTSEFNYHRRIHTGEKPYQCKVCHKFFRGRSTIKCHLKTHAGALMYRCTVCGHYKLIGEEPHRHPRATALFLHSHGWRGWDPPPVASGGPVVSVALCWAMEQPPGSVLGAPHWVWGIVRSRLSPSLRGTRPHPGSCC